MRLFNKTFNWLPLLLYFTLCKTILLFSVIKFYNFGVNCCLVSFVSRIDCIGRVAKGEADIVILEPEEIYVAHRFFHDAFYIATEVRTQSSKQKKF